MNWLGSMTVLAYVVIAVASVRTELATPSRSDGMLPMSQFFVCVLPLMLTASAIIVGDARKRKVNHSSGPHERFRTGCWTIGLVATCLQVISWRG